MEKVPALVPRGLIFMQMRNPDLHSLIGSNNTVLIGQYNADEVYLRSLDWRGQVSAPWSKDPTAAP